MEPTIEVPPNYWEEYRKIVPKGDDPKPDDNEAQDLRTNTVMAYIYLCKRVVAKMKKTMPTHVERDDLESWAKIGLLQAITRYDHTMGVPFEAFATQRMRSVIMDGIRDADWAPRSLRKKQRDFSKIETQFVQDRGREPTPEEIAAVIVTDRYNQNNIEPSQQEFENAVREVMADINDTKYKSDIASHTYIESSIEVQNKISSPDPEEDQLIDLLKSATAKCLQNMEVRKAAIIALHYYAEKKLAYIAHELNMSETKVGSLHSEAVMEIWNVYQGVLRDDA